MDIKVGDFPPFYQAGDVLPVPVTAPMYYWQSMPVAVLAVLTEQDKEALKAMIREVVTEVVNEALDERERRADEAKRREFWEI